MPVHTRKERVKKNIRRARSGKIVKANNPRKKKPRKKFPFAPATNVDQEGNPL